MCPRCVISKSSILSSRAHLGTGGAHLPGSRQHQTSQHSLNLEAEGEWFLSRYFLHILWFKISLRSIWTEKTPEELRKVKMNFQMQFWCIRYITAAVDRYRKCQISCLHLCCLGTFNLIATDVILDAWQGRHQMKSCLHPATRSNLCSSFSSLCRDLATGGYSLWASDRTFFQKPPRPGH